MKEQPSNPCEKVSFILTYDQLEAAYNIYREQFISCDFIRRSMERLEERIGLCNLPYETLRDDPSLRLVSLPDIQQTSNPNGRHIWPHCITHTADIWSLVFPCVSKHHQVDQIDK